MPTRDPRRNQRALKLQGGADYSDTHWSERLVPTPGARPQPPPNPLSEAPDEVRWGDSRNVLVQVPAGGGLVGEFVPQTSLLARRPARTWNALATLQWLNYTQTFVAPETITLYVQWTVGVGAATHYITDFVQVAAPWGTPFPGIPPSLALFTPNLTAKEITFQSRVIINSVAGAARDFQFRVAGSVAPVTRT